MAASQLCGSSGLMSRRSLRSLRFSPLTSRVSSSPASLVELDGKCFRAPVMRISIITSRKLCVSMCLNGTSSSNGIVTSTATKYTEEKSDQTDWPLKANPNVEPVDGKMGMDMHVQTESVITPKRSAKIHDFCLGIPFGGFIFAGGLVGFFFRRNPASLTTGMLLGATVLALSMISLKVWRKGKSSFPFIFGQAVIATALLRKYLQSYSLAKQLFPTGFYIFLSAAMICFYSYVVISGGNPPPKKLAAASTS